MHIFEAIGLVASATAATAVIGLVTSRITAYWLQFTKHDMQGATVVGVILPVVVCLFIWGPLIEDHYRIESNLTYFAVLFTLSSLVLGSSVAFVMIAASILKDIYAHLCALIDRMFAKRN